MAIALLPLHGLFTPVQSFVHWLGGGAQPNPTPAHRSLPVPAAHAPRAARQPTTCSTRPVARPQQRPLRVVRVWEGPLPAARAGRMVISGRMADVCAELDRLAALEAQRPSH